MFGLRTIPSSTTRWSASRSKTVRSTVAVTSGDVAPETTVAEVAGPEATAAAETVAAETTETTATENVES